MGRPVVLVGCGRLGSALVEGWMLAGPVRPDELIILTPSEKPVAEAARAKGARINPGVESLAVARAVVLAVKPATWRGAAEALAGRLATDAVILSLMAGVRAAEIEGVLNRPVTRVMPTTGVAQALGTAAVWAEEIDGHLTAMELFQSVAALVPLESEDQMDAATATLGSAPAFILSFAQALVDAGTFQGLDKVVADELVRGALLSAAVGVDQGASLDNLIARIASPGGTTRAGMDASAAATREAARAAIDAAVDRARALGSEKPA